MREIILSNGMKTQVSNHRYDYLNQFLWCFDGNYAVRNPGTRNNRQHIKMHTIIAEQMGLDLSGGKTADHKDRNKLNNQDDNLRPATKSQQKINGKMQTSICMFRGVGFLKSKKKNPYQAKIRLNGCDVYIGCFK